MFLRRIHCLYQILQFLLLRFWHPTLHLLHRRQVLIVSLLPVLLHLLQHVLHLVHVEKSVHRLSQALRTVKLLVYRTLVAEWVLIVTLFSLNSCVGKVNFTLKNGVLSVL